MLEAERAGAKALVVFMDSIPRNSEHWTILRRVQAEEAHNCALIGKLLEARGVPYSHATGEFYEKALAVQGNRPRVEFLVRGLRWAVREFNAALPRMAEAEARRVFEGMKATHERSIAACEAVARSLR